jgi:hypothetical protein
MIRVSAGMILYVGGEDMAGKKSNGPDTSGEGIPEPQGKVAGVPYDFRRPTVARNRARWWNPDDGRFFTPKVVGAGWDINVYWLIHPLSYIRLRQRSP